MRSQPDLPVPCQDPVGHPLQIDGQSLVTLKICSRRKHSIGKKNAEKMAAPLISDALLDNIILSAITH